MGRNREFTRLAAVTGFCLSVAACQRDSPTSSPVLLGPAPPVAGLAVNGLDASGTCSSCVFEPRVFERSRGAPRSQTIDFPATAGRLYVVDLDDVGSRGTNATVTLNGDTLLTARRTGGGPWHYSDSLRLKRANTMTVRLTGKPGSKLRLAVWLVQTVTLDAVTLAPGTMLEIGGPGAAFNSTITNHTTETLAGVRIVTSVRQGSAQRVAGDALVACGASAGVLPVGTCVRIGDEIVAQNTGSGSGTLVVGAAEAVIEVRNTVSVIDSVLVPVELTTPATSFVITGIKDIRAFLEECPTDDPAYAQIRQDFDVRVEGQPVPLDIACNGSYSTLPIDQLTDELIALQVVRTAYYMSQGTQGHLPWTQEGLWEWMSSRVSGVNIKTTPGAVYCCDVIDGKWYISLSRQADWVRELKRTWPYIAHDVAYYSHEIRHADPGAPGHTTGCPAFPLPTDPYGCDQTYDVGNLGSYGVQYWLEASWATGYLNVGIGCSPLNAARAYAEDNAGSATMFATERFVTNPPPTVTATQPYGGPCVPLLSTRD